MATWDRGTLGGNGVIGGGGNSTPTSVNTTTSPSTNTTSSNGTSSTSQNQSSTQNTSTVNMDPSSLAALQGLIQQLLGGGTREQAANKAQRQQELNKTGALRDQYTKAAAFADAQGAMNQFLRQAMEQAMPSLARAAEGAGTSANSMRALLTQDALTRASEGAAALGLNTAAQYGTVGANYSSVLERLSQADNSVTEALLGALNIAKGAVTNSTTTGSSSSNSTTNTSQSSVQNVGGTNSTQTRGDAEQFAVPTAGGNSIMGASGGGLGTLTNAQWNELARMTAGVGGAPSNDWATKYQNF